MRESISKISVPLLSAPAVTPRTNGSQQDALFMDLQRLIEEEKIKEEKRVSFLK